MCAKRMYPSLAAKYNVKTDDLNKMYGENIWILPNHYIDSRIALHTIFTLPFFPL